MEAACPQMFHGTCYHYLPASATATKPSGPPFPVDEDETDAQDAGVLYRLHKIHEENQGVVDQAKRDLARPAPTMRNVAAAAVPNEIEESVTPWAELGIAGLAIFAPSAAAVAMRYRKKYKQFAEGVEVAADDMDEDTRETLLTELSKAQDRQTKELVDEAQTEAKMVVAARKAEKAKKDKQRVGRRGTD